MSYRVVSCLMGGDWERSPRLGKRLWFAGGIAAVDFSASLLFWAVFASSSVLCVIKFCSDMSEMYACVRLDVDCDGSVAVAPSRRHYIVPTLSLSRHQLSPSHSELSTHQSESSLVCFLFLNLPLQRRMDVHLETKDDASNRGQV